MGQGFGQNNELSLEFSVKQGIQSLTPQGGPIIILLHIDLIASKMQYPQFRKGDNKLEGIQEKTDRKTE